MKSQWISEGKNEGMVVLENQNFQLLSEAYEKMFRRFRQIKETHDKLLKVYKKNSDVFNKFLEF